MPKRRKIEVPEQGEQIGFTHPLGRATQKKDSDPVGGSKDQRKGKRVSKRRPERSRDHIASEDEGETKSHDEVKAQEGCTGHGHSCCNASRNGMRSSLQSKHSNGNVPDGPQ
jgi:hypothetical protein